MKHLKGNSRWQSAEWKPEFAGYTTSTYCISTKLYYILSFCCIKNLVSGVQLQVGFNKYFNVMVTVCIGYKSQNTI